MLDLQGAQSHAVLAERHRVPQTPALGSQRTKGQVDLLVQCGRDGVIVGRSLQLLQPLPACLCRRSRWGVLRRVLDAHTCSWFPALLLWQIWLPVFTSDGRLNWEERREPSSATVNASRSTSTAGQISK